MCQSCPIVLRGAFRTVLYHFAEHGAVHLASSSCDTSVLSNGADAALCSLCSHVEESRVDGQ